MDAVASYHRFTTIRYFGVSGGQRKKFTALPSAHADSNCSSHSFALICLR